MVNPERGSATVVSLALVLGMLALAGVGMLAAGALLVAHTTQTSADRAALAAADVLVGVGSGEPCVVAREILIQSGAQLLECELSLTGAKVVAGSMVRGVLVTRRAHAGITNSGQK